MICMLENRQVLIVRIHPLFDRKSLREQLQLKPQSIACRRTLLLYFAVLYCTVLYCTVLYCTVLYCTVLYFAVLYCTSLYCTVLYFAVLYCTSLYCTVLYCTVLYCTLQTFLFSLTLTLRRVLQCTTPHHTTSHHAIVEGS